MADPVFYQRERGAAAEVKARLDELRVLHAAAFARWEELEALRSEGLDQVGRPRCWLYPIQDSARRAYAMGPSCATRPCLYIFMVLFVLSIVHLASGGGPEDGPL